jgi:hypothetical protein
MQEVVQDKVAYKVKADELRDRAEMLASENAALRDRVTEGEDEAKQFRK